MKKVRVLPALLIAGLGFLAGALPSQAGEWLCRELHGEQCLYPSLIFCFWSEEEVGACDCQEASGTYVCYHTSQASSRAEGGVVWRAVATQAPAGSTRGGEEGGTLDAS